MLITYKFMLFTSNMYLVRGLETLPVDILVIS